MLLGIVPQIEVYCDRVDDGGGGCSVMVVL